MCGATPLTDGGGIGNGAAAAAKRDIGLFKCVICCGVSGVGRATDDDVTSPGSTLLNSAAAAGDVAAEEMSFSGDEEETADVTATESLFPIILSIENVDLRAVVVVAPLAAGVSDACRARGLAVFGPTQAAAALEASKAFTKEICDACGAPTARWRHGSRQGGPGV